jgi:hypothetical protein
MKDILGELMDVPLMVVGLILAIAEIAKGTSDWTWLWAMVGLALFGWGLESLINRKIGTAKADLMDAIDEQMHAEG